MSEPRAVADGSQPEGLSDSSRWSQRSEDHRKAESSSPALWRSARFFGHLFQVRIHFRFSSGGLRYAATTGYYLTAFQADIFFHPVSAARRSGPAVAHGLGFSCVARPTRLPRGGTDFMGRA